MLNIRSFAFDSAQYHLIYGGIYQVNLEKNTSNMLI